MMKRKIEATLLKWKQTNAKALLVRGARQIGKTYSIRAFLGKEFSSYKEVNFATNASALMAFSLLKDYEDFELQLDLLFGEVDDNPDTAVFFDEIQMIYRRRSDLKKRDPKALDGTIDILTLIKEAVQKDKRRYVFSGSLLGISLEGLQLSPAGYLYNVKMHPMDFEEFLWAKKVSSSVIAHLRDCFEKLVPVNQSVHKEMLSLFKEYVLIGGMPEAVDDFVSDGDFSKATIVQEQIVGFYHRDIVTYTSVEERLNVQEVFDTIPSEIDSKNKRFVKTNLDLPNAKNLDLTDRFLWLAKAGVALPVYNVSNVVCPLRITEQRKTLKLFLSDVGLLSCLLLGEDGRKRFLSGEIELNYGAPFENAAAEELTAHGYSPLHYWDSKKNGEIDFVVEQDGTPLPIEIKSGKTNDRNLYDHRALDHVLDSHPEIKQAMVFGEGNLSRESDKIIDCPIYLIGFLANDRPNPFED